MNGLTPADFESFFFELHDRKHEPFPWQRELALRVCTTGWPAVIDLPTASGKTACIDIALFAFACSKRAPRRIFFVVDRKVIVDEAYERMRRIAARLKKAEGGTLGRVAARLRELAGGMAEPLHVYQLRGGIYRDESWVRSPLQPTVVTSTVDQVGSRILFRGYGVSDSALPIHAGLIANDALILLDEAHCSKAFAQTLDRIQRYRSGAWAERDLSAPFRFVEMTATPSRKLSQQPFRLGPQDRESRYLGHRLTASKPTRLIACKAKPDDHERVASVLVDAALELAASNACIRRIAIMTNRVGTARAVHERLGKETAILLIGRMRPVDRDDVVKRLDKLKAGEKRDVEGQRIFVVATQCLEVGADLDFDALVTECASMDALLQRFGRLDRLGEFRQARGCIIMPVADPKRPDPVYGVALAATRAWLEQLAAKGELLDFGVEGTPPTAPQLWRQLGEEERRAMTPPAAPAPALLPTHLDTLVQTSPRPVPEPDVGFFLHGREPDDADVLVAWRADLPERLTDNWAAIVRLCPPVVAETLPVKLWAFRRWMAGSSERFAQSDTEGGAAPEDPTRRQKTAVRNVVVWRGESTGVVDEPRQIRPGDTVVLPCSEGGADVLGYVPAGSAYDVGDRAFLTTRSRLRLRLHAELIDRWPDASSRGTLKKLAASPDLDFAALRQAAAIYRDEVFQASQGGLAEGLPEWLAAALHQVIEKPERDFDILPYPDAESPAWVIEGRRFISRAALFEQAAEADEQSAGAEVPLDIHTRNVRAAVMESATSFLDGGLVEAMGVAAEWHDAGKCDPRFQTLLHGGDAFAARFAPKLLAKGRFIPRSRIAEHWERSGLPGGFRHELLSLALAERAELPTAERDLILHLVANHHGRCRALAPVVLDDASEAACYAGVEVSGVDRLTCPAHDLAAGVPDRFWRLTRLYGWWGLAYIEALFRLADWRASGEEQRAASKGAAI